MQSHVRISRALFLGTAIVQLAAIWLLFPANACATLITATTGGVNVIVDQQTNLAWVPLTQTMGDSPNTATSSFPGFQLATEAQIQQLFSDAGGFTAYDYISRVADGNTALTILNDFGTSLNGEQEELLGYFAVDGGAGTATVTYRSPDLGFPGGAAKFLTTPNCLDCSSNVEADFLIAAYVAPAPEPNLLGAFGFLLVTLAMLLRKLRSRASVPKPRLLSQAA